MSQNVTEEEPYEGEPDFDGPVALADGEQDDMEDSDE